MAAASTDTTADEVAPRRRGKSKAPNFKYDGPVSVIRVELDVADPAVRRRVERQWTRRVLGALRLLARNGEVFLMVFWR